MRGNSNQNSTQNNTAQRPLRDGLFTVGVLALVYILCTLLQSIDPQGNYVSLLFVLAVAVVSRWTEGYFWGIFAAFAGVVCVNFVFTYPYFAFNFTMTGYPLTFLAMFAVSVIISAMNTQIKKGERLRRETERETMRANLMRAMSHDIRTPLTSIVGNTAALLESGGRFTPEQERTMLLDANEDAQWLIRMVENLLSITRVGDMPTDLHKELEAPEEVVAAAVKKFQKRFPAVKLQVEVPEEVLLVPMDATLIQQVLMNLLENAVLHGETTTCIQLNVRREGEKAVFSVHDNGQGIPRAQLSTVFESGLSHVSHNNFDMKRNMGIGLSVCRTIVRAHGGEIEADNPPEGGARFRFTLPLKEGSY